MSNRLRLDRHPIHEAVRLDLSHPLCPSAMWVAGSQGALFAGFGVGEAVAGDTDASLVTHAGGIAADFAATGVVTSGARTNAQLGISSAALSFGAKLRVAGQASVGVFGRPYTSTHSSPFLDFVVFLIDDDSVHLRVTNSASTSATLQTDGVGSANGFITAIGTWDGATIRSYNNGTAGSTAALSGSALHDSGEAFYFGGNRDGGELFGGDIEWAAIWPFVLSPAQARDFTLRPYQILIPRRTIYLPATSAGETVVGAGGVSASGSVGSVTATGGALVQPTGLSATGDVGTVTVGIVETVSATGVSASGAVGTPTVTGGALVELAGVSATGSLGSVTVAAGALVQPSGVSATGQVGTVTTAFDMAFAVSGVSGTGDVGTVTVSGVGDATADATGVSASGSVGSVTVAADHVLSVSGVSAEGQIGTVTATGGATVAVSGAAADGEVGVATVISGEVVSVSGVSAAGQVGTVTITTGALAALAGVQAVGRIGNVGVLFDATVSVTGLSAAGSVGTVIVQTGVAIARGPITPAIARGPITPAIPRA